MCYFFIIFVLLGIFCYMFSGRLKYFIKMFFFFFYMFIGFALTIIVGFWRPNNPRNFLLAAELSKRTYYISGLEFEIEGKEILEKKESFIIVANHQSPLDFLTVCHFFPLLTKCAVITRAEFQRDFIYAIGGWIGGMIFIDRTYTEATKKAIDEAVQKLKEEPRQIFIHPEARDFNTGTIHPFKKGAFHMAIQARVPIVPVVISQYTWYEHFKRFDSGKVIVKVLPPVKTDNYTSDNVEDLSNYVWNQMNETFNELKNRI